MRKALSKAYKLCGKAWSDFADELLGLRSKLVIKDAREIITDIHTIRYGKFTITFMTGIHTCTQKRVESFGVAILNPADEDDPNFGQDLSQSRALKAFKARVFRQPITERFMG